MKSVIRMGTFETNSSTCHAFARLNKEMFDKWKSGGYLFLQGTYFQFYPDDVIEGKYYAEDEVASILRKEARESNNLTMMEDSKNPDTYAYYGFFSFHNYVLSDDINVIYPSDEYQVIHTYHD